MVLHICHIFMCLFSCHFDTVVNGLLGVRIASICVYGACCVFVLHPSPSLFRLSKTLQRITLQGQGGLEFTAMLQNSNWNSTLQVKWGPKLLCISYDVSNNAKNRRRLHTRLWKLKFIRKYFPGSITWHYLLLSLTNSILVFN